jgi:hypothetical protein
MTRKSLPTAELNALSRERYLAKQPIKARFDGASVPKPKLSSRDPDQFHTLRKATNNGRYGRKK